MLDLIVHPRLTLSSMRLETPIATDMARHIDWKARHDAILDEPLFYPTSSCVILRIEGLQDPERPSRFIVSAADYITVTVRDFLLGLNCFLHRRPEDIPKGITLSLVDDRAMAETQYAVDEVFAPYEYVDDEPLYLPPKTIAYSGFPASEGVGKKKPTARLQDRVVNRWFGGRSKFVGIGTDETCEAQVVVYMVLPGGNGPFSFTTFFAPSL